MRNSANVLCNTQLVDTGTEGGPSGCLSSLAGLVSNASKSSEQKGRAEGPPVCAGRVQGRPWTAEPDL